MLRFLTQQNMRRERIIRDRTNPYDFMRDDEFASRYRFRKQEFGKICELLQSHERATKRNSSLPVSLQACIALRFFAQGGYLAAVGDIHHVSKSTACQVVDGVARTFSEKLPEYQGFPDFWKIKADFFHYGKLPKVIGCIDGTHVEIKKPLGFINRKGVPSINVLLVCGLDLQIYYSLVRYPGSCHDSFILNASSLSAEFNRSRPDGWILGDSGYPAKSWLLTPLAQTRTPQEEEYQKRHSKCRSSIERCNGLLKGRFRCLLKCLEFSPEKVCVIIRACILLHNKAIQSNQDFNDDDKNVVFE